VGGKGKESHETVARREPIYEDARAKLDTSDVATLRKGTLEKEESGKNFPLVRESDWMKRYLDLRMFWKSKKN